MELTEGFSLLCSRDEVVERLCRDETLLELFPGQSEILASKGDQRTVRTRYRALGREGEATFNFSFLLDGSVAFEKRCDGRVWRALGGTVSVEEGEDASTCRVEIRLEGATKALVPEFTIKGPMDEQIAAMCDALRELLADG